MTCTICGNYIAHAIWIAGHPHCAVCTNRHGCDCGAMWAHTGRESRLTHTPTCRTSR